MPEQPIKADDPYFDAAIRMFNDAIKCCKQWEKQCIRLRAQQEASSKLRPLLRRAEEIISRLYDTIEIDGQIGDTTQQMMGSFADDLRAALKNLDEAMVVS